MSTQPVTFWQSGTWSRVEVNEDDEVQFAIRTGPGFRVGGDGYVRAEIDVPKLKELLDAAQEFARKRRES